MTVKLIASVSLYYCFEVFCFHLCINVVIFQGGVHGNLHVRVCHEGDGERLRSGQVYLPQGCLELARLYRH